jgi:hypothetical protein
VSGRGTLVLVVLGLSAALGVIALRSGWGAAGAEGLPLTAWAPDERVRVEVLNAGGVSGLARTATTRLREAGFDVVQFGNARTFDRDSSVVLDRVGRLDLAEAVANALGIPNVLTEPDPNLFVDVTVLLGRTWPGQEGEQGRWREPPQRAPWDPRGWLGR